MGIVEQHAGYKIAFVRDGCSGA